MKKLPLFLIIIIIISSIFLMAQQGVKFVVNTDQTVASSFTSQNDVTGSRAYNTVYQNTTGKVMFISACGIGTQASTIILLTDSSNPPTTQVSFDSPYGNGHGANISGIILPNNYYKVTFSPGSPSLDIWVEWY